jgi:hypothetical protein
MWIALFFRIRRGFGENLPVQIRAIASIEKLAFGGLEGSGFVIASFRAQEQGIRPSGYAG